MKKYQLVLLLTSDLTKSIKEKAIADVKKCLGNVSKEKIESIGEKKLAYPIKGQQKGDYILIHFESDSVPKEFEKSINIVDNVMRYLLVRE